MDQLTRKCDEAQPSCKKCKLYGVACDYSSQGSSLELDTQGSFQVQLETNAIAEPCNPDEDMEIHAPSRENAINSCILPLDSISINSSLAAIVDESLRSSTSNPCWMNKYWHFTNNQLQVLSRFRERTSVTIGHPQMAPLYRDLVCQLACKVRSRYCMAITSIANHITAHFSDAHASQCDFDARCPPSKPFSRRYYHEQQSDGTRALEYGFEALQRRPISANPAIVS